MKVCLCSEACAHTLGVGDQQGVVMAIDIVYPQSHRVRLVYT